MTSVFSSWKHNGGTAVHRTTSHLTLRRVLRAAALAAFVSSLFAGEVLIDQHSIAVGKVSPGDVPGYPATISQSGTYRLMENLVVPDASTTAIQITADYVTLDLNGFSIIGPNVCLPNQPICSFSGSGVGVHAGDFQSGTVAPKGVRVLNGTVRGMGFHGVRLIGDSTAVVGVTTENNGGPGIVVGQGRVTDSVAHLNGGVGIIAWMARGNTATENHNIGLYIRDGGVASDNIVNSNAGHGIYASVGSVVAQNSANNNKQYGISAICPGTIVGNATVANTFGSIQTTGACVLANNSQ